MQKRPKEKREAKMPDTVRNRYSLRGILLLILVAVFSITGCSSSAANPGGGEKPVNGLVQSSSGGAVTIDVKWLAESRDLLTFDVSMNTHSVDLDSYNLKEIAVLRDDKGNEYRPISWDSTAGGHHVSGKLTFSSPTSLAQGEAKYIQLSIRDIAGVKERVLKWELS